MKRTRAIAPPATRSGEAGRIMEVVPDRVGSTGNAHPGADSTPVAAPTTIRSYPDGPLLVRGSFVLEDVEQGTIPVTRSVIALCRCGRSKAAPMCDGSHRVRRSTRIEPDPGCPGNRPQ